MGRAPTGTTERAAALLLLAGCVGGVPSIGDDSAPGDAAGTALIASGAESGPEVALTAEEPEAAWEVSFTAPGEVVDPGSTTSAWTIDLFLSADEEVNVVAAQVDCESGEAARSVEEMVDAEGAGLVLTGQGLFGGCEVGSACTRALCVTLASDGSVDVTGTWSAYAEIRGDAREEEAVVEVAFEVLDAR